MIRGSIIDFQGRVQLRVKGQDGRYKLIEAIVDTGFTGSMSLPALLIDALGLAWDHEGKGILADGTESNFDVFVGMIQWHGKSLRVSIVSVNTSPLIGMALLAGSELNMKVREHGVLTIKSLPKRR